MSDAEKSVGKGKDRLWEWLFALTPMLVVLAISMAWAAMFMGGRFFPDELAEEINFRPNNFFEIAILFNFFIGIALLLKYKWRHFLYEGLMNFRLWIWGGFLAYMLLNTNLFDLVVLRRIAFGASLLPLFWMSLIIYSRVPMETSNRGLCRALWCFWL